MTPSVLLLTASKNGLDRSRLQLHFTDGIKSEVAVEKNDDVSAQRENRFTSQFANVGLGLSGPTQETPWSLLIPVTARTASSSGVSVFSDVVRFCDFIVPCFWGLSEPTLHRVGSFSQRIHPQRCLSKETMDSSFRTASKGNIGQFELRYFARTIRVRSSACCSRTSNSKSDTGIQVLIEF